MEEADPADVVRSYYAAIDDGDYDGLADLLTPAFVHDRPDRTLEGRKSFVAFMRDERPVTDTVHLVDELYRNADRSEFIVRGRLRGPDGEDQFAFLDVHSLSAGRIADLRTFIRRS